MQENRRHEAATPRPPEYFPADHPWEEREGATLLIGMRCSACGTKAFPARTVCSNCGAESGLEPARLGPRGTLYTWSEVHIAPKDFATPYVIGYVDLEDGVRVVSQIEGPGSALVPDQKVEATTGVVRTRGDGTPVISYRFRSIER